MIVKEEIDNGQIKTGDSERLLTSSHIVKNHVMMAMGLGFVPVPLFDLAALTAIQVKMIHSLTRHYNISFEHELANSIIASLLSGIIGTSALLAIASALKIVPVFGSLIGATTVSALSSSITFSVGRVFTKHFESGGTLLSFDPVEMHEQFNDEFQADKEINQGAEPSAKTDISSARKNFDFNDLI